MPEFSSDAWSSFKEQFLSVIRFILYSFDLFFDACRSHPMLYAFFFFPIFAAAFFVVLFVVIRLSHIPSQSNVGNAGMGFNLLSLHGSKSDNSGIAHNLAKTNSKLDSIDLKLGKVSTGNVKMPGTKGEKLPVMKGASVNNLGKADSSIKISSFGRKAYKSFKVKKKAAAKAEASEQNKYKKLEKDYLNSEFEPLEGSHPELDIDVD